MIKAYLLAFEKKISPDKLDPKGDVRTNLGGRFKYYREVNQFGYNGTSFLFSLNVKINK